MRQILKIAGADHVALCALLCAGTLFVGGCISSPDESTEPPHPEHARAYSAGDVAFVDGPDDQPPKPTPKPGEKCPTCDGTGKVGDGRTMVTCGSCDGTGKVPKPRAKPLPRQLVYFGADWCPSCKRVQDEFGRLAGHGWKYGMRETIWIVNSDNQRQLLSKYDVKRIPTFILFEHGKEVWRHVGFLDRWQISQRVKGGKSERPKSSAEPNGRIERTLYCPTCL